LSGRSTSEFLGVIHPVRGDVSAGGWIGVFAGKIEFVHPTGSATAAGGSIVGGRCSGRRRENHMSPTFELGRIAGIRIGINWSWLIVSALIV